MRKGYRVLLIGPLPDPVTGVSLANKVLYEGLLNRNICVNTINTQIESKIKANTGNFGVSKILNFLRTYFKVFKIPFSDILNITIGQTVFGVIKYLPFLIVAKLLNKVTVVHLHGGFLKNEYDSQSGFKKRLMLYTLKKFDYGIVLSNSLKVHLNFFLDDEKVFVCKNFYEDKLKIHEEGKKNYKELRIVFLSNLIEGKGINLLMDTLKKINSDEIKVRVAGNVTPENVIVLAKMKEVENLEYLGVVSGKEKADLLSWGNVFCLPTFYKRGEGQPISIIEAMAFGNFILTTKHGGIPDICSDKNGIFVNKNDQNDLESKIRFLLKNKELIKKKGSFNKIYAYDEFREEVFIENMIKIFDKCLT